jgi:hypothetical protein
MAAYSAGNYREQYQKILPKKDFKYYEIYNASEGFFAIQDLNNSSDLLLMLDWNLLRIYPNGYFWNTRSKLVRLAM